MNIMTTGCLGKEFYNSLINNELRLSIRYAKRLSQDDISWADALASFPIFPLIKLESLKWIHSFGAGVEPLLERNDLNKELILSRTVGSLGRKMGEYCLGHLLNFSQRNLQLLDNQKNRLWIPIYPNKINSNKVLIIGTGEMAKGISKVFSVLGICTIGINTDGHKVDDFVDCLSFTNIENKVENVTCIINALPHCKSTYRLIDKKLFRLFDKILFINVGRGSTIVLEHLEMAICKKILITLSWMYLNKNHYLEIQTYG